MRDDLSREAKCRSKERKGNFLRKTSLANSLYVIVTSTLRRFSLSLSLDNYYPLCAPTRRSITGSHSIIRDRPSNIYFAATVFICCDNLPLMERKENLGRDPHTFPSFSRLRATRTLSPATFPYLHLPSLLPTLPRHVVFPSVMRTCVRTFVRYERVRRRKGVSGKNIDVLLKLNRIDDNGDEDDDVRLSAPPSPPSPSLLLLLHPPRFPLLPSRARFVRRRSRCRAFPTCAGMRVRASFYRILLPRPPRAVPAR